MKLERKISKKEISTGLGGLFILTVQVRVNSYRAISSFLRATACQFTILLNHLLPHLPDLLTSPVHLLLPLERHGIYLGGSCSYFETKEVKNNSAPQEANLFLWFCELCQTIWLPDFQVKEMIHFFL